MIFTVTVDLANQTVAAGLRRFLPGESWSKVRSLLEAGRVKLNGDLWRDDARRLKTGDVIEVLDHAAPRPRLLDAIVLRHVDEAIVVAEKPAGISTVRHPAERDWLEPRRLKTPTLDDLVLRQLGEQLPQKKHHPRPRLRIVHRLDKETSGLVVFARTVDAERGLGVQFREHTVERRYLALVVGTIEPRVIRSYLMRDRGDGRRGGTDNPNLGKLAVTHVDVVERFPGFTLVSCRLETGRTHQIRIHLAESGHPVCGDPVYHRPLVGTPTIDRSGSPRLFLHATILGFRHPTTGEPMRWEMPPPADLRETLDRLRGPSPR